MGLIKGDTRSLDYSSFGAFPKLEVPFWRVPYNKDYSIFGSILGSPYLGKLPYLGYCPPSVTVG